MDAHAINLSRRGRLQALLDSSHFEGNKRALGIALGFKDGAYVRQLLEGERPISEKLVSKIHSVRGGAFKGWFEPSGAASAGVAEQTPSVWPLDPFISREQWDEVPAELRSVGAAAAMRAIKEAQALMSPAAAIPKLTSGKRRAAGGM